jgi:hypothetical protein
MFYSCALALNLLSSDVVLEQRIFAFLSIFEINESMGRFARFSKAFVASRFIRKGMPTSEMYPLTKGLRFRWMYGSIGFCAGYDFLTISTVESEVTDVQFCPPVGLLFFQDLFPQKTGRELKIESKIDTINRPVAFRVVNFPATVREDRWYECTVIATNVSPDEILKKPKDYSFITLKINGSNAGAVVRTNERGTLKPGETLTQTIRFRVTDAFAPSNPVRLEWYFFSNRLDD